MELSQLYQVFQKSNGVETDTRKNLNNKIFFGFKGEYFNGNEFAEQAINNGAQLAIVQNVPNSTNPSIVVVQDVLKTLQDLARYHRMNLKIPVIGITGSNGKTTTKELTYRVLAKKYHVNATQGNFNNLLGLPLTILKTIDEYEILLLEMGSNESGEIAKLCDIALPDFGLITNIGRAHLEGFGSIDGVLKEKSALYHSVIKKSGVIFISETELDLMKYRNHYDNSIIYGIGIPRKNEDEVFIGCQRVLPNIIGELVHPEENIVFQSPLMGKYNAMNCAAAASIGYKLNVSVSDIGAALSEYEPTNNRSQILKLKGGITVLLDAYNANPDSMMNAIQSLMDWPIRNKIAILGDMKEMGIHSEEAHRSLITYVEGLGLQRTFFIGSEMMKCYSKAYLSAFEIQKDLLSMSIQDCVILIKGSRSMKLEQVLDWFYP